MTSNIFYQQFLKFPPSHFHEPLKFDENCNGKSEDNIEDKSR